MNFIVFFLSTQVVCTRRLNALTLNEKKIKLKEHSIYFRTKHNNKTAFK